MGGKKTPTREGSFPLGVLEKGDEVANLVDSSNRPPGVSLEIVLPSHTSNRPPPHGREERFLELAFPHPKPTANTWSDRGEGEHVLFGVRRAVAASSLLRDSWLRGAVREAQAALPLFEGGGV